VCVCVCERERERERLFAHPKTGITDQKGNIFNPNITIYQLHVSANIYNHHQADYRNGNEVFTVAGG